MMMAVLTMVMATMGGDDVCVVVAIGVDDEADI